jgi:hypothetical protein
MALEIYRRLTVILNTNRTRAMQKTASLWRLRMLLFGFQVSQRD